MLTLDDVVAGADPRHEVVRLGEDLYWVGHALEDDPFQCHVYLLAQGDQSVVFDPGSVLTFRHTLRKIEQIVPLDAVRYWVCHHQDPDICGALPLVDQLVARDDAVVVTHWRAEKLIRHLGLQRLGFWLVDQHGWRLRAGARDLRFVFTPYAHFPGAFCSFDPHTGTLFSSDLFGGFTERFSLLARDAGYLEGMRPFHEHYIPSREVMRHALDQILPFAPTMVAPQHGSLLRGEVMHEAFRMLGELDCGLYLLDVDSDIERLMRLGRMLREATKTLLHDRDFRSVASTLRDAAADVLPVEALEFWVDVGQERWLCLAPETRYRGHLRRTPERVLAAIADRAHSADGAAAIGPLDAGPHVGRPALVMPLDVGGRGSQSAAVVFRLREGAAIDAPAARMLERLASLMAVAVEREALTRAIDLERQQIYERSIRDPLTGLYTRRYLTDVFGRLASAHDRDEGQAVSVALIDIDHFKSVNDTYGHPEGDRVLTAVARALESAVRRHDVVVRMGGEEFAVFVAGESAESLERLGERIRRLVASLRFDGALAERRVTVSIGLARRQLGEALDALVARGDAALYRAKSEGRDRALWADAVPPISQASGS